MKNKIEIRLGIIWFLFLTGFIAFAQQAAYPKFQEQTLADGRKITYTNLGAQLLDKTIEGSAFYEDTKGKKYLYTVVRGQPAHLLGYELESNNLIADIAMPSNNGSPSLTFSTDGTLYISGQGGILYAHTPGSDSVRRIGQCLPKQTVMYDLRAGVDGEIYGGTYPNCQVFRYHPKDGFTDVGKGTLVKGESYVRSMVYHQKTNKIYAGVGARASLIELDLSTGAKRDILPEEFRGEQFVYTMALVEGVSGGDRIFITLQNSNNILIFNIASGRFEHQVKGPYIKGAIKSPLSDEVYFTQGANRLLRYDNINASSLDPVFVTDVSANVIVSKAYGNRLFMLTAKGQVIIYDTEKKEVNKQELAIVGQPKLLGILHEGPAESIWTGGYLNGANASYDPKTGNKVVYEGLNQTESAASYGDKIYFGTYTKAKFYSYDSKQPWHMGKNPKQIGVVPEQDRPFGALSIPDMGKVFFGTVPGYGMNGGVLVEFDVSNSNKMSYYKDVVKDQSIITLLYDNKKVFGGSSIWGGLGGQPLAAEAVLFVWDIVQKKKIHEVVPVKGAKSITCLIHGNDGYIWGLANGYLFKVDPVSFSVVSRVQILSDGRSSHVWRPDYLVFCGADGMYYGSIAHQLFRLNPKTMAVEKLNQSIKGLLAGPDNEMYFYREGDLWRIDVK
ncbi:NHL repeat-containing protein [Sphingobacterium paucimobilis]|uniref:Uncharacterized protein n=1 Tax=Sphingobacterium paucimobilis HER1398 TaxID=1346330 RepID=U2JCB5_9SPHI|nr:hypothetical protein [Sphingobacterium paucimobilis]ERJ57857.1 hypothetical protein M472_03665 [Sphingobacterium paucimobilis HER1398]ERJ60308.1 hypothetical protein M472_16235 [Sphingobacterium paucimobilis HER1398]